MKNVCEVIREKYGDFFENSLNLVYALDLNGNFIDANDNTLSILEYEKEDISNLSLKDLLDREELLKALKIIKMIERGVAHLNPVKFKLKTKNGKFMYIENIGIPIKKNGEIYSILCIANNITEFKIAEENFQYISENVNDLIAILETDYNFKFEYINEKLFLKILGYRNKNLIGQSILDYIHPDDERSFIKAYKKGIGMKKYSLELRIKSKEKVYKHFEVKLKKIKKDGDEEKLLIILSDLSKLKELEKELEDSNRNFKAFMNSTPEIRFWKLFTPKKYEEALKSSYEMLQMVMDNIPEYIFWKDTNLVYLGCNNNYAEFIGAESQENIIGKTDKDLIKNKEKLEQLQEHEIYIIKTDNTVNRNIEKWKLNNGKTIWLDANRICLHDFEGNNVGLLVTYKDISKEILAEQKLKESEEKYRLISENANDLIAILDNKFKYEYINEEVHKKILGYSKEDLIGKSALIKVHPKDLKDTLKNAFLAADQGEGTVEIRFKKKNGTYVWLDVRGKRLKYHNGVIKGIIISRDITQHKIAEQRLKESEEKFRNLYEKSPNSIVLLNNRGIILDYNPASEKLYGFKKSEVIGKNFFDLRIFSSEQVSLMLNRYTEYSKGTKIKPIELQIKRKDGSLAWILAQSSLIEKGDETLIQGIAQDITEKKKSEQKLREAEEEYRLITENANDLIRVLNDQLEIEYINELTHLKILGYSKNELIGKFSGVFAHPDEVEQLKKYAKEILRKGESNREGRIRHKNGSWIWMDIKSKVFFDKEGNWKVLSISREITDRKKAEKKLKESEERYRVIVDTTYDGHFEVDLRGNFTYVNKRICEFLGISENDLLGMNFRKIVNPDDISNTYREYNRLYRNKPPLIILEYEVITREGKKMFVENIANLKRDSEGKIVGFYGYTRDITERKEFQAKLENEVIIRTRELNEALSQQKLYLDQILKVSQFKTEFLSSMSHDLRTPLNSIIGFTDILLEGTCGLLNEDQKDYLNDIKLSSEDLLNMIDHIFNISRIEAGQLTLTIRKFSLNTIVEQINSTIRPLYSKKGLQFEVQGLDKKEDIYADPIRFKEILYNLLSNAIKFTIEGKITLIIQNKSDFWLFKVKDTGIGIEEKDFEFIFKEFKRIDSSYVRSTPGSGLGLSLAKRLVELHKGEISFNSIFGKGTTFKFTISKDLEKEEEDIY
ncbi:MAG: PAS domain S-box protein [Promethearchaeota archaeon]